jgi:non-ribosomal peptide synthetase component E (peptide arylation enzyme)
MPRMMNWVGIARGRKPDAIIAKEFIMRNKLLAIVAIAGAVSAPIAAKAQSEVTTGVARGGPVVVDGDAAGIAVDQVPAFRQYIIREHVPDYTIPDRVVVGGVLPETGVTYYDVPQTFGITPYSYSVVNGRTILVEPRTRRIVQVVE